MFSKGHLKSEIKMGSGGGNLCYISSVINNDDQSYSAYTEADV